MIKWLKTLFGKHESQKTVELNLGQEKLASDAEAIVEVLPNISTEEPLHTLYRVGPSFLTYQYSIDEDVAFEITEEEGLIGPYKYRKYVGAIQAIDDNDNFWFLEEEHEKARKLLMEDLKTLAKDHGMIGAYSNLGTLCMSRKEQLKYWEKGAKLGDKSCMVDYAIDLYCDGRTAEGFQWLKKGADLGDKLGCLLVAISYNYGTLSEIDYDKAAEYYLKTIDSDNEFFAYLNLGCMLADSGYYHTAIRYFEKMQEVAPKNIVGIKQFGSFSEHMSNLDTCRELLQYPYSERTKHLVLQAHSRRLDSIFCTGNRSIEPWVPEHVGNPKEKWKPNPEIIEIDTKDIDERENSLVPAKRAVDKFEDYMFLSIPVKIDDPEIYGTQQELVFLEKECHAELNKYIQDNLINLRSAFKKIGYILTYLPSHLRDLTDFTDKIGSYYNDYGHNAWDTAIMEQNKLRKESDYWNVLVPSKSLPEDCAGFLRFVPSEDNMVDHSNYEYILFPYRPGTDWPRAFNALLNLLRGKPIVPIFKNETSVKCLPAGSILEITPEYDFVLKDNCDSVLAEVKMPTLSKVLYLVLLDHPEGIAIKTMIDYKEELWSYYQAIAGNKAQNENIDALCNPINNSVNEKISRIKSAFTNALSEKYYDDLPSFIPTGKRGEAYSVSLDRNRVRNRGNKN